MTEKATAKEFEAALDEYGAAAKGGNVSMMEKNRVALLKMAGFEGKPSNSPENSKPSATPNSKGSGKATAKGSDKK